MKSLAHLQMLLVLASRDLFGLVFWCGAAGEGGREKSGFQRTTGTDPNKMEAE
jgi:hypothetical protein